MENIKLPNLEKELDIKFKQKPLIIGGLAKEYYGVRKSGKDVDIVLSRGDHNKLKRKLEKQGLSVVKGAHKQSFKKSPKFVDLSGDQGILYKEFEIWNQICGYDYTFLSEKAINKQHCKIISLEKMLFLTALAIKKKNI